jgi:hypothetical protein
MQHYGTTPCPMALARAVIKHEETPLVQNIIEATNGRFEEIPYMGGASSSGVTFIMNFDRRIKVLATSTDENDRKLFRQAYKLPRRVKPT